MAEDQIQDVEEDTELDIVVADEFFSFAAALLEKDNREEVIKALGNVTNAHLVTAATRFRSARAWEELTEVVRELLPSVGVAEDVEDVEDVEGVKDGVDEVVEALSEEN